MAASTKRFTLTDTAYTDVSEGATRVSFVVRFDRQRFNAVRLSLGQSPPAADAPLYQNLNPGIFQVGQADYPQDIPVEIEVGEGDRVYLRAERDPLTLGVHRK